MPAPEKLDPNLQAPPDEYGLVWTDARELLIEGQGWASESQPFTRLPDRAKNVVSEPVWHLSRHSAGLRVCFSTDAPSLSVRWSMDGEKLAMPHMPASGVSGLDLYCRDANKCWRWAGAAQPTRLPQNQSVLLRHASVARRDFLLYLPLYIPTTEIFVGVPSGFTIHSPATPSPKKPICFYGTSIVQGGCASRPGLAYPALLGRHLDRPHWNLGFSGNGKAEPEMAHLMAELDAALYVIDPLPNMDTALVQERMGAFIDILRDARPQTPIVLLENLTYQNAWVWPERQRQMDEKNAALRLVFDQLTRKASILYVSSDSLLGSDSESTVDGTHPNDLGMWRIAQTLEPILTQALGSSTGEMHD